MARLCYSTLDMFSDLYGCMRGPQRGERGDPNAELHRRANPAFLDALKQAHFSDIDRGKKGTFDFAGQGPMCSISTPNILGTVIVSLAREISRVSGTTQFGRLSGPTSSFPC